MKISKRFAAAGFAALTTVGIAGSPALAAAPGNDLRTGAVTVAATPYSTTLDTTEATTDSDDTALNTECGAPATDASVWYSFTAPGDGTYVADATGSDYSAGVFVASGGPGAWTIHACGPGGVIWDASAGETYTLMVIDDQSDGGGNGGQMSLRLDVASPPPVLEVSVNKTGWFNSKTGTAVISGTATCGADAEFAFLDGQLTQQVGRLTIRGFGGTELTCDGTAHPWSVEVLGDNGIFKGGKAVNFSTAVACGIGGLFCSQYDAQTTIQLKGKK